MRASRAAQFIPGVIALLSLLAIAAPALLTAAEQRAASYPEPNIVQNSWELDIKIDPPAIISVQLPDEPKPRLYNYITYTVTNRTGNEQLYVPDLNVLTDAGDLIQLNRSIPPLVFQKIKERLRNPLLESPSKIVGSILQGADNARDGVAIWPVADHDINNFKLFFGGLSGETHSVKDPATGKETLLRKTLELTYETPGDEAHAQQKPFVLKSKTWIVR